MGSNNRIVGTDNADEFRFDGGSVIYYGGLGNDWIWVEGGVSRNCFFYGGEGDDRITVWPALGGMVNENIYIDGGVGNDKIFLELSGGLNTVFGGAGDDSITVSVAAGSNNRIYGGDGHDRLTLWGGTGAAGVIFGGNGNDIIRAWTKNVTVSGGSGADEFSFCEVNLGASTGNHIKDFSHSGGDYITLNVDSRLDTKTIKYDVSTGEIYCNSSNFGGIAHCTIVTLDNKPSDFSISSDVRVIPV